MVPLNPSTNLTPWRWSKSHRRLLFFRMILRGLSGGVAPQVEVADERDGPVLKGDEGVLFGGGGGLCMRRGLCGCAGPKAGSAGGTAIWGHAERGDVCRFAALFSILCLQCAGTGFLLTGVGERITRDVNGLGGGVGGIVELSDIKL
jgi:hypothetical protein